MERSQLQPDPDATAPMLVAATTSEDLVGRVFGRYQITSLLGRGGMAEVYVAIDHQLDRQIALKLIPAAARQQETFSSLLWNEAVVMARLSHPNVVQVYDVGMLSDRVFIAMELVDGTPLDRWLGGRPGWREIVAAFVQAAHGLAAAHRQDIIHRDFKPGNVLVGRDGRVRVADFGVATLRTGARAGALDGAVVGTVRYMAPEQREARAAAHSDQFGFGVALYEALWGCHPFQVNGTALLDGSIVPDPPENEVPAWIRAAVLRALAIDPAARWPSMDALIAALTRDPGATRRRWALAALVPAGALAAVAIGYGLRSSDAVKAEPCAGADRVVATWWNPQRREQIRAALGADPRPYRGAIIDMVDGRLGGYAGELGAAHLEACAATRIRQEHSEELLDRRMTCLQRLGLELSATAEVLASEHGALDRAVQLVTDLPSVAVCADLATLTEVTAPSAADADRVAEVRARLARARALRGNGESAASLELATVALEDARAIAYAPLIAEAQLSIGSSQVLLSDFTAAEQTLSDAAFTAHGARTIEVEAMASIQLIRLYGYQTQRFAEAHHWNDRLGDAVRARGVSRLDALPGLGRIELQRERVLALLAGAEGDYQAALTHIRRALTLTGRYGSEVDEMRVRNSYGNALYNLGRLAEAEIQYRGSVTAGETVLGDQNPALTPSMNGLANSLADQGRYQEELPLRERSIAIADASFPPGHVEQANAYIGLGTHHLLTEEPALAIPWFRKALAIYEQVDDDEFDVALCHHNLCEAFALMGDDAAALTACAHAADTYRAAGGPDHPEAASALVVQGHVWRGRGDWDQARTAGHEALRLLELAHGADSPQLVDALLLLGTVALAAHDLDAARTQLSRALTIAEANPADAMALGEARFAMARLLAPGDDRARALELAEQARVTLAAVDANATLLVELDAWLATHRAPAM